jgi:hypothetical protein
MASKAPKKIDIVPHMGGKPVTQLNEEEVFQPQMVEINQDQQSNNDVELVAMILASKTPTVVDVFGHKVSMRTISAGEELQANLMSSRYTTTNAGFTAYIMAVLSFAMESIDGVPIYQAIADNEPVADKKFEKLGHYRLEFINECWDNYQELLEKEQDKLLKFQEQAKK